VYSPFEEPRQTYAITPDAPAINIDRENHAAIVTRGSGHSEGSCFLCVANRGTQVEQSVALWNAFSGSAQIITGGRKTIPCYRSTAHAACALTGSARYSEDNSWYDQINARTVIGLSRDRRRLILFVVDKADGSEGMSVGEVADLLIRYYGVHDALNMDGGGSTTLALENPSTGERAIVNTPSDKTPGGRPVGSSLAIFASRNSIRYSADAPSARRVQSLINQPSR
jgi:hypothetical protein